VVSLGEDCRFIRRGREERGRLDVEGCEASID
jgi:hypothetical protein